MLPKLLSPLLITATCLLGVVGCASVGRPTPPTTSPVAPPLAADINAADIEKIDAVLSATRELLLLAPDVARVSWNEKNSPADRSGDEARLQSIQNAAKNYDIEPSFLRDYFQALIEADRYVQVELHRQWRAQRVPPTMTLTRTKVQLQAASAKISPQLLTALTHVLPALKKTGAAAALRSRALEFMPNRSALSEPTRNIVMAPLLSRAVD